MNTFCAHVWSPDLFRLQPDRCAMELEEAAAAFTRDRKVLVRPEDCRIVARFHRDDFILVVASTEADQNALDALLWARDIGALTPEQYAACLTDVIDADGALPNDKIFGAA